MRGGAEVKLSKRAGSYMTVRELVEEVGRDAVRYFYLMRRGETHFVFDVDLAKSQTDENPVFYVQMAHARMAGIFRVAGRDPASVRAEEGGVDLSVLTQPEEADLIKALADFPATLAGAAAGRAPSNKSWRMVSLFWGFAPRNGCECGLACGRLDRARFRHHAVRRDRRHAQRCCGVLRNGGCRAAPRASGGCGRQRFSGGTPQEARGARRRSRRRRAAGGRVLPLEGALLLRSQ